MTAKDKKGIYVKWQCLMNRYYECVENCKSTYSKLTGIWHGTLKKQTLFTSFRHFGMVFRLFWPILMFQNVLRSFFKYFTKVRPSKPSKNHQNHVGIASLYPIFGYLFAWTLWPGDLRWPWPPLGYQSTDIYTWVQMSDTLSLVICWLCLRLRHFGR